MENPKSVWSRTRFPPGHFANQPGAWVTVKDCPSGYSLPAGLIDGDSVKVLNFDHGYYTVEKDGGRFEIFLANVVEQPRRRCW